MIKKIRQTDDTVLLKQATKLLDREIDDSNVYVLSESEKADIEEGRQQIKKGDSFTYFEANQVINERLKK